MSDQSQLENGLEPDNDFIALISEAVQENEDAGKSISPGEDYLVVNITPTYATVIKYFIERIYPKKESSILDPKAHRLRWQGAFLHQQGKLPNPPQRACIILPLKVVGSLEAKDNIALEVGRSIYVDENSVLELVGSGKLLSINLGFSK